MIKRIILGIIAATVAAVAIITYLGYRQYNRGQES
jgi:hypothetical protein